MNLPSKEIVVKSSAAGIASRGTGFHWKKWRRESGKKFDCGAVNAKE